MSNPAYATPLFALDAATFPHLHAALGTRLQTTLLLEEDLLDTAKPWQLPAPYRALAMQLEGFLAHLDPAEAATLARDDNEEVSDKLTTDNTWVSTLMLFLCTFENEWADLGDEETAGDPGRLEENE